MQVLIIGNGFDIAHGLPTQYKQFLDFIKIFQRISVADEPKECLDQTLEAGFLKEFFYDLFFGEKNQIRAKLDNYIQNNRWIVYFLRKYDESGENWIDFETEISKVIRLLEQAKRDYEVEAVFYTENTKQSKSYSIFLKELFGIENNVKEMHAIDFKVYKNSLLEDLNRLILALEIYLLEYVEKIPLSKKCFDIEDLNPEYVLSFNYTNTYQRLYADSTHEIKYAYIHGNINYDEGHENNMTLGIDEYLSDDERCSNIEFIDFQKFYQRMQKKTLDRYKKWYFELDDIIMENGECIEVYIFGHSLDLTDKDILEPLLMDDNFYKVIFYHDKEAHDRCIKNLVRIMNRKNLDEKMYGKYKTIELREQG